MIARDRGVGRNTAVVMPAPTNADIASRVSKHREAVTREMNALARDGLIERRDRAIVIVDIARLAQRVETGLEE